jgi:hypothetical protein
MELNVIAIRNMLRICLDDEVFMGDYVPAGQPACAVEIIDRPYGVEINVLDKHDVVLYSRLVDFSYARIQTYVSVIDGLPMWVSDIEKSPRFKAEVEQLADRIRLSIGVIDDANHPNMH